MSEFNEQRIEALQNRLMVLETWILELTAPDCPEEYKKVVRTLMEETK